jgi:threonine dehydratase
MSKTDLIKIDNFYIKREDQNKTGSAKDRAVVVQIQNLINKGYKQAVISSTGNAAISASYFCHKFNIPLTIFLSPKINPNKLKIIKKYKNKIIFNQKPISSAFKFSKTKKAYFLRQSTDPTALVGYSQIGAEINQQFPQVSSIFVPVGSGTTLLGISQKTPSHTKIFAVQPSNNPTITSKFDSDFTPQTNSLTDSLSVKYIPLKKEIINTITKSAGGGLTINDQQIEKQLNFLRSKNIITSPESALALAGLQKARQLGIKVGEYPLVIFTGSKR